MHKAFFLTLLLILASASAGFAQAPAFDPREWKGAQAGPTTKVLNLGSKHLSQISIAGNKGMLSALLDKLAVFKPDIITVEDVSGEQCEHVKRYSGHCRLLLLLLTATAHNGTPFPRPVGGTKILCDWR